MQTLGTRIRQRREQLGLTQDELAQKMGYKSRSSVNKIESGANDIPQSKVQAFADALDTTSTWLLGLEPIQADAELEEYLEQLKNREDMRMLFSVTKNATKEDVMRTVAILEALRSKQTED